MVILGLVYGIGFSTLMWMHWQRAQFKNMLQNSGLQMIPLKWFEIQWPAISGSAHTHAFKIVETCRPRIWGKKRESCCAQQTATCTRGPSLPSDMPCNICVMQVGHHRYNIWQTLKEPPAATESISPEILISKVRKETTSAITNPFLRSVASLIKKNGPAGELTSDGIQENVAWTTTIIYHPRPFCRPGPCYPGIAQYGMPWHAMAQYGLDLWDAGSSCSRSKEVDQQGSQTGPEGPKAHIEGEP